MTMNLYPASVADVMRCNQRDQTFVSDLESQLHSFLKYLNGRSYQQIRKYVPMIANAWYYYMTSLGNLQTLGEEYAGTIRISGETNTVPSKLQQMLWMILYIGGDPLINRTLIYAENQVRTSISLTQHAKDVLLKCIDVFREEKEVIKKIHHVLFYISGKYYNLSNRLTGIKYVLLRDWLQDSSFAGSFKLLGELSLFYILFSQVQKVLSNDFRSITQKVEKTPVKETEEPTQMCILCVDNMTNPTCTPCGHIFCWECIFDCLEHQKVCPICREEVQLNRIICLQNYI